jgi:hypothetical protein
MKIIGNKQVAPVGRLAPYEHASGTGGALARNAILGTVAPGKMTAHTFFGYGKRVMQVMIPATGDASPSCPLASPLTGSDRPMSLNTFADVRYRSQRRGESTQFLTAESAESFSALSALSAVLQTTE